MRTIGIAYKDLVENEGGPDHQSIQPNEVIHDVEKFGFTLLAILGIKDVIRSEVPKAV